MFYNADLESYVFPKYAKISFKISKAGSLIFTGAPSFTPGKLPPGISGGRVPKGIKIFDYSKEVTISIGFSDCVKIVKFFENKSPTETVDLFRNTPTFNKIVKFSWLTDENNVKQVKLVNINFVSQEIGQPEKKFYLPISISNFEEMVEVIKSYMNSYGMIKLYCQSSFEITKKVKPNEIENLESIPEEFSDF